MALIKGDGFLLKVDGFYNGFLLEVAGSHIREVWLQIESYTVIFKIVIEILFMTVLHVT